MLESNVHGYNWYLFSVSKCGMFQSKTYMFMNIISIDLFPKNVGMPYANDRLRCGIIPLALVYFTQLGIWHVWKF